MAESFGICIIFAVFMLLHYFHHASTSTCNSLFVAHPQNILINEGGDAVFRCTVSNFSISTDTLIWEVNPSQYYSVISQVYDQQTKTMTSSLNVYRIGMKSQTQQCVAFIQGSDGVTKICSSDASVLNVQYFPREDTLECEPKGLVEMKEEHALPIGCRVSRGIPEVQLKWKLESDRQDLLLSTSFVEGTNRVLLQNLVLDYSLHNTSIVCEVTSPTAFPDRKLSCTIGPLIVSHKPRVTLFPSSLDIPHDYYKQHRFICNGSSFPVITAYSWSCFPVGVLEGCDLVNNSDNAVEVSLSQNNTCSLYEKCRVTITCKALNLEGTSFARSLISIAGHPDSKEQNMTYGALSDPKNNVSLSLISTSTHLVNSGGNEANFICSVENYTEGFTIVWAIGNRTISENNTDIFTGMYYQGRYFLGITKLTEDMNGKYVYCKYVAENGESLMAVNLSLAVSKQNMSDTLYPIQYTLSPSLRAPTLHHGKSISSSLLTTLHPSANDFAKSTVIKNNTPDKSEKLFLQPKYGSQYVILIAISAAIFGIVLAACIFGAISLSLHRRLSNMRTTFRPQQFNISEKPIQSDDKFYEDQNKSSVDEIGGMEPAYEEPNVVTSDSLQRNNKEIYSDSMVSYYEANINDCGKSTIYSSSTSSSLCSNKSFSDSYSSDGSASSSQLSIHLSDSTENCIYTNQSVLQMQTT